MVSLKFRPLSELWGLANFGWDLVPDTRPPWQ